MNCNELLREVQKRLVESGISDLITEYVHEHPEYWTQNDYGTSPGYNTSCSINVGFNTISNKDVNDMTQTTPFYMLEIGRYQSKNIDMSVHPNSNAVWTDYWYQGKIQLSYRGKLNG